MSPRTALAAALAAALVAAIGPAARAGSDGDGARSFLPQEPCGAVYWDLTAAFDAGDRVYARVLVTNDGPGERTAVGLGHWIDPAGHVTEFRNGRREGRWQLEADGRRVHIGSTVLDRSKPDLRFEVDNDKRGVKVHLALGPALDAAGHPALEGDYAVTVEALAAPAAGTVWRRGMANPRTVRGWGSLVRTRHRACEHEVSVRRLDLHMRAKRGSALLVHHRAADGTSRAWLGWRALEGPLRETSELAVEVEARPTGQEGYPAPTALRWSGEGVEGSAVLKSPHFSIDPVDALPRLVQMLYSLRSRPQRLWADAETALRLKAEAGTAAPSQRSLRGPGVASTTYLGPLEPVPPPPAHP